jgi:hypothetical protein
MPALPFYVERIALEAGTGQQSILLLGCLCVAA